MQDRQADTHTHGYGGDGRVCYSIWHAMESLLARGKQGMALDCLPLTTFGWVVISMLRDARLHKIL